MEKLNVREAYERMAAINARFGELAESLKNDKKRDGYSDAENAEIRALKREYAIIEGQTAASRNVMVVSREADMANACKWFREQVSTSKPFEVKFNREVTNMSTYADGLAGGNPFGLTTQSIVEPLYAKSILKAVGAPLLTGLKGNHQWPVVEAFKATVEGEGVALGDTKIPVSKLVARPERIGISVDITREALNETDNLLQTVATQYMPEAVSELMNEIMFSKTKVAGATMLQGPFADMKAGNKKTYTGDAPTLKELIDLKSIVLKSNVKADQLCYVMTETTKGMLEATPKWDGSSASIVDDNGRINGVPVYTSSVVAEGDVLFGAFKYAPQGFFGDMSFIVDPYSQANANSIRITLNTNYAITTLRKEAFAMLTK